jgi:hypothetical protein
MLSGGQLRGAVDEPVDRQAGQVGRVQGGRQPRQIFLRGCDPLLVEIRRSRDDHEVPGVGLEATRHIEGFRDIELGQGADDVAREVHLCGAGGVDGGEYDLGAGGDRGAIGDDEPDRLRGQRDNRVGRAVGIFIRQVAHHPVDMGLLGESRQVEKLGIEIDPAVGSLDQPLARRFAYDRLGGKPFVIGVEKEDARRTVGRRGSAARGCRDRQEDQAEELGPDRPPGSSPMRERHFVWVRPRAAGIAVAIRCLFAACVSSCTSAGKAGSLRRGRPAASAGFRGCRLWKPPQSIRDRHGRHPMAA